jgi:3'-5' exonuclease
MPASYSHILFLDIETVAQHEHFEQLSPAEQDLWTHKAQFLKRQEGQTAKDIYEKAAIYAEFGKIICICCGVVSGNGLQKKLTLKSFSGHNEKQLLEAFLEMLQQWKTKLPLQFCAHNGKEFDFAYLARRIIINQLPLPIALQIAGKKPWEITHIDTMELWKFGDYKSFTSLNLLANCLGLPTPKDDIDGSQIYTVYYQEKKLERIVTYCLKDVATVANIYFRLIGEPIIEPENIITK